VFLSANGLMPVAECDLAEVITGFLLKPANKRSVDVAGPLLVTPATPISISIIGPPVAIAIIRPAIAIATVIWPIAIVATAVVVADFLDRRIRYSVSIQQPGHGCGCRTRAHKQPDTH
jgi:hypothetical protein